MLGSHLKQEYLRVSDVTVLIRSNLSELSRSIKNDLKAVSLIPGLECSILTNEPDEPTSVLANSVESTQSLTIYGSKYGVAISVKLVNDAIIVVITILVVLADAANDANAAIQLNGSVNADAIAKSSAVNESLGLPHEHVTKSGSRGSC